MIKVKDAAGLLGVTDVRIKQVLNENKEYEFTRTSGGVIQIAPSTVQKLLCHYNMAYKSIMATIGIEKGGCGKSLLTCNTAIYLSRMGCRVLIVDLDPEAHATHLFLTQDKVLGAKTICDVFNDDVQMADIIKHTHYSFLDIAPCGVKARKLDRMIGRSNPKKLLETKLENIKKHYDLILFDVSSWYARIIESAYISSDIVIIPTLPDIWSIESVKSTIDDIKESSSHFEARMPEIKVLMNKYNQKRIATSGGWELLLKLHKDKVLPFQIKDAAQIHNAINEGLSVFEYKTNRDVKESFCRLANTICPLVPSS